jgi:hypothetical protein
MPKYIIVADAKEIFFNDGTHMCFTEKQALFYNHSRRRYYRQFISTPQYVSYCKLLTFRKQSAAQSVCDDIKKRTGNQDWKVEINN